MSHPLRSASQCWFFVLLAALGSLPVSPAVAQTIEAPFAGDYSYLDLGQVPGVPVRVGGLTFLAGDPNTLLVGGDANAAAGALYSIGVVRDVNQHIIGFSGAGTYYADAAYNDGGVVYGPDGVLFTSRWPVNELGQLKPGSTITDKIIGLAALGVEQSHAALNFVPAGFPGAGRMKLVSWAGGQWSDASLVPDGAGTFDVVGLTPVPASQLPGGPEGFIFVSPLSPGFATHSLLVAEWSAGNIATYDLDANGDPIVATRRTFMSDLSGAEGGAIDPLTGDFIFTTFGGGDRLVVVRGFVIPEPSSLLLAAVGLGALGAVAARRRQRV